MPAPLVTSWLYPLTVALATLPYASATQYSLAQEYYGSSFFDAWTFYNNCASIPTFLESNIRRPVQMTTLRTEMQCKFERSLVLPSY